MTNHDELNLYSNDNDNMPETMPRIESSIDQEHSLDGSGSCTEFDSLSTEEDITGKDTLVQENTSLAPNVTTSNLSAAVIEKKQLNDCLKDGTPNDINNHDTPALTVQIMGSANEGTSSDAELSNAECAITSTDEETSCAERQGQGERQLRCKSSVMTNKMGTDSIPRQVSDATSMNVIEHSFHEYDAASISSHDITKGVHLDDVNNSKKLIRYHAESMKNFSKKVYNESYNSENKNRRMYLKFYFLRKHRFLKYLILENTIRIKLERTLLESVYAKHFLLTKKRKRKHCKKKQALIRAVATTIASKRLILRDDEKSERHCKGGGDRELDVDDDIDSKSECKSDLIDNFNKEHRWADENLDKSNDEINVRNIRHVSYYSATGENTSTNFTLHPLEDSLSDVYDESSIEFFFHEDDLHDRKQDNDLRVVKKNSVVAAAAASASCVDEVHRTAKTSIIDTAVSNSIPSPDLSSRICDKMNDDSQKRAKTATTKAKDYESKKIINPRYLRASSSKSIDNTGTVEDVLIENDSDSSSNSSLTTAISQVMINKDRKRRSKPKFKKEDNRFAEDDDIDIDEEACLLLFGKTEETGSKSKCTSVTMEIDDSMRTCNSRTVPMGGASEDDDVDDDDEEEGLNSMESIISNAVRKKAKTKRARCLRIAAILISIIIGTFSFGILLGVFSNYYWNSSQKEEIEP